MWEAMQYRNASDDVEHLLDFWAQCVLNTADGSLHSDTVGKTTYLKMTSYTFANSQAVVSYSSDYKWLSASSYLFLYFCGMLKTMEALEFRNFNNEK